MNKGLEGNVCFSCGGEYILSDGPVHRYMDSSPGCWAAFGEILTREYSNPSYFEVHQLTVDAYAVQHPGKKDRQSIQSVAIHLIRLCLILEHGLIPKEANHAMKMASKMKKRFTWLKPPLSLGSITAADVIKAKTVSEHKAIVRAWAKSVWEAWSVHHNTIKKWLPIRIGTSDNING